MSPINKLFIAFILNRLKLKKPDIIEKKKFVLTQSWQTKQYVWVCMASNHKRSFSLAMNASWRNWTAPENDKFKVNSVLNRHYAITLVFDWNAQLHEKENEHYYASSLLEAGWIYEKLRIYLNLWEARGRNREGFVFPRARWLSSLFF